MYIKPNYIRKNLIRSLRPVFEEASYKYETDPKVIMIIQFQYPDSPFINVAFLFKEQVSLPSHGYDTFLSLELGASCYVFHSRDPAVRQIDQLRTYYLPLQVRLD